MWRLSNRPMVRHVIRQDLVDAAFEQPDFNMQLPWLARAWVYGDSIYWVGNDSKNRIVVLVRGDGRWTECEDNRIIFELAKVYFRSGIDMDIVEFLNISMGFNDDSKADI